MSEETIDWSPEEAVAMASELNRNANQAKNEIAEMYFEFRYNVSQSWSGNNYNKVVEYVNGYAETFKHEMSKLAEEIPNRIYAIANEQAASGQGTTGPFQLISDNHGNPNIWTVPLSTVYADGKIQLISPENVRKYFIDTPLPSVRGRMDSALKHVDDYVAVFDTYAHLLTNNQALKTTQQYAIEYKATLAARFNEMCEVIQEVAKAELDNISDTDIQSIQAAKSVAGNGGGDGTVPPDGGDGQGNGQGQGQSAGDGQRYTGRVNQNTVDSFKKQYEKAVQGHQDYVDAQNAKDPSTEKERTEAFSNAKDAQRTYDEMLEKNEGNREAAKAALDKAQAEKDEAYAEWRRASGADYRDQKMAYDKAEANVKSCEEAYNSNPNAATEKALNDAKAARTKLEQTTLYGAEQADDRGEPGAATKLAQIQNEHDEWVQAKENSSGDFMNRDDVVAARQRAADSTTALAEAQRNYDNAKDVYNPNTMSYFKNEAENAQKYSDNLYKQHDQYERSQNLQDVSQEEIDKAKADYEYYQNLYNEQNGISSDDGSNN